MRLLTGNILNMLIMRRLFGHKFTHVAEPCYFSPPAKWANALINNLLTFFVSLR